MSNPLTTSKRGNATRAASFRREIQPVRTPTRCFRASTSHFEVYTQSCSAAMERNRLDVFNPLLFPCRVAQGFESQISALEHATLGAHLWKDAFHRVERERTDVLLANSRAIEARQKLVGNHVIRDQELETLRQKDYLDTYRLDLELLISLTESVVFHARAALLKQNLSGEIQVQDKKEDRKQVEIPEGPTLIYFEQTAVTRSLLEEYEKNLHKLLELHTAASAKNGLPAGPEYNRGQGSVLKAAMQFAQEANTLLPKKERAKLASIFAGKIPPYHNPVNHKPNKLVYAYRGLGMLKVLENGAIQNRAMHLIKNPNLKLFLDPSQLPAGMKMNEHFRYRMKIDQAAQKLAKQIQMIGIKKYAKDHPDTLLGNMRYDFDDPQFLTAIRKQGGALVNRTSGLKVSLEFAPGAKGICEQYIREFGRTPRILFVPTHTGTSDQGIFLEGMPESELDRMFSGLPGRVKIVARPDYDKNIPKIKMLRVPPDQEALYGVTLIDEADARDSMRDLFSLAEHMEKTGDGALLFAVGGRNPFNHSHNPLVPNGLSILAAHADLIIPISIPNSTGEELRGGASNLIIGRPALTRDFGIIERGGRTKRKYIRDLDALIHYLWQEQKQQQFVKSA